MSDMTTEFEWEAGEDAFPLDTVPLTEDKRTEARICAVQALYQALVTGVDARDIAEEFANGRLGRRKADKKLFNLIMAEAGEGAARYRTLLEAELRDGWEWARVDPVLRALGWAGSAELTANADAPVAVVVNEYLNISKGFVGPDEVAYLHRVLDGVGKKVRG